MKIIDIKDYIKDKATKIKKENGDKDHKDRIKMVKLIPPFVVRIMLAVSNFLAYNFGLNILLQPILLQLPYLKIAILDNINISLHFFFNY